MTGPAESILWVAVEARQALVTVPAACVAQAVQTLAGDVVAVASGTHIPVPIASTRLAVVSNGEWVAVVPIRTAPTVGSLVTHRTGRAGILLRRQAVLVVVYRGHLTSRTEVVGGHVQRTLARMTIVGPPQLSVAIVAFGAGVAMLPHRVVFTLATCQCEGVTGGRVSVTVTRPALALVDGVVEPCVAVAT